VRQFAGLVLTLAVVGGGAYALAQGSADEGVIGPANRIQPSGRLLHPSGKLTRVGNHPAGAALTPNGRFYWTLSAGRGRNDVRIVRVAPGRRCRRPRQDAGSERVRRYRSCVRRARRPVGRVVQTIRMPGLSGGIAMAPDGRTAYLSGIPDSAHEDEQTPPDTPGREGDVVHVLTYNARTGHAARAGTISLPPPADAPIPQSFPPTNTKRLSWPRDLAVSPDGKTLLVALNLADYAAVVDLATGQARFVRVGSYPYGAAITRDGKRGLVSNEASGTVSVIDLASATKIKDIQVGPHLSHLEGIAIDPQLARAYVAVTHQDLIAVLNLRSLTVQRTLTVERSQGIGTAPVAVKATRDGCFLLSADSGEDAVAVFALPNRRGRTCRNEPRRTTRRAGASAEAILQHEGRRGLALAAEEAVESRRPVRRRSRAWQLVGRVPVASYPVDVDATARHQTLVWLSAKGLGVGPNPNGPNPYSPNDSDDRINSFQYLPSIVRGASGILPFPTDTQLRRMTPRASRQLRPSNAERAPAGTPIRGGGPIKHVFYIVRENRTYDQVLGDDSRGDGDPKLTLFGANITPNAHALARRFPLLDHVYANSEASIDGHFWSAAAAVSDYVTKNWHQNYAGRQRPYDFGVYAVTWPSQRFLFDQAEKQGISYFNFGEAVAGVIPLFPDKDRTPADLVEVNKKFAKSDLGPPLAGHCFPNDAWSGGVNGLTGQEVYDSSLPPGVLPPAESRFDCLRTKFTAQLASNTVPAFTYITLANDHTAGTAPGRRTPNAMVADNDYALGQVVDLISHSPIWGSSLILVIEDDSQDGADHVDAHRIPALAISPYARRGAVVHTRYDFLSFIRTLEIVTGMKPLNLFDALAVPMYDAFGTRAGNAEPYDAIKPGVDLNERNSAASPNAGFSQRLPLLSPDQVPQRYLDRILWQYVHGKNSEPPPPGPNASGEDERAWEGRGSAGTPGGR
jgi:DNA-binding beta-propeller fold protein YncE